MEKMRKFECEYDGFKVQSRDEKEVLEMASTHMKKVHPDMKVSKEELKSWLD